jgi:hypothetical protein
MEHKLLVLHLYRMPCIAATLVPHYTIGLFSQEIGDFPFAFVPPLSPN